MNFAVGNRRLFDHGIEGAFLGAVFLGGTHALQALRPDDFTSDQHRSAFEAMLRLHLRGSPIELPTVVAELGKITRREPKDITSGLLECVQNASQGANADAYADQIRELSTLRGLISIDLNRIVRESDTADTALSTLRQRLDEVDQRRGVPRLKDAMSLARDIQHRLERAKEGKPVGLSTGFYRLDRILGGLRGGGLYVLGGRPGQGKSAFALNLALHASLRVRAGVLMFSLEMAESEVGDRIIASETRIDSDRISDGRVAIDEWPKIAYALGRLSESGFWLDDRCAISVDDLSSAARRLAAREKIGLVVVDYLQLAKASEARRTEREQQVAEISHKLKQLARDINTPVLALSQLNREIEKRDDKRPRLSDFRESGAIEADADAMLALHRPYAYDEDEDPNLAIVHVLKHRHGGIGQVKLRWDPQITRFDNLAPTTPEED